MPVDAPSEGEEDLGEPEGSLTENPRYLWRVMRMAVDYLALNTETGREMMRKAKPYPDPFVFSHVAAHAGAELGCWVGMRPEPGPLILFVPGTFQTKDASTTRGKVLQLFERTGAHVCVVDQRGFGHSSELNSTAGYLEALDMAAIARDFADDDRVTHVVMAGESLGGSVALIAATLAPDAVDGVLAMNPFADLEWMVRLISTHPPRWDPAHVVYHAFEAFLRHITGDTQARFDAYLENTGANLGLTVPEIAYRASPRFHTHELSMPTLILHATDDPVIPAFHAHVLSQVTATNPNVRVHVTARGGHTTFDVVDEAWYWGTVMRFFEEATT